jgi:signal peptidase II
VASDAGSRPAGPDRAPPVAPRRTGTILGVAAAVIVLDQLTKWWAVESLSTRTIDVVWTLRLNLVENRGSAFSLTNSGGPWIGAAALVVVGVLLWWGRGVTSRLGAVAMGLVAGGAVGNLIDRAVRGDAGFLRGPVIDFIDLRWWPVFNVADMGVVIGGILLVLVFAFQPPEGGNERGVAAGTSGDAGGGGDA